MGGGALMGYINDLYNFFTELSGNNCREWLDANRDRYLRLRELWLSDVDRMLHAVAQWEPAVANMTAKNAAYRFNRDIRFSPDKSPYKLYFSAAFGAYGKSSDHAGYYLHLGLPQAYDSGLYGGLYCPEAPVLRKLRKAIVDNIEEFEIIVGNPRLAAAFPGWVGQTLKTIPKGWEKDHPQAHLLRLKEYGKYMPCDEAWFSDPDWPLRAADAVRLLKPLIDFLNYSIDE